MSGVVALCGGERVVTVCCGGHRTDCCDPEDCAPCCPECVTCPEVHQRTLDQRAEDARVLRARLMHTRMQARQAELVLTMAALDDLLDEVHAALRRELDTNIDPLVRATKSAVALALALSPEEP